MAAAYRAILLAAAWGLAAAATSVATVSSTPPESAALGRRLDALFAAAYPADGPGAAVIVQRGEEVLLRRGYGLADLEMGVPIAPEMVLRIGSVTKQFTAVAVLLLASEGRLDLDAPLRVWLRDYPEPGAAATLRQLLTHTAGIPDYTNDPGFWKTACLDRGPDELIAGWKDKPLDFPPGTGWNYSSSGYILLGRVIEAASGRTYARFLEERIFGPLGLKRTFYDEAAMIVRGRVKGYDKESDGYRNTPCVSMNLAYAAGALVSGVDDLVKWGKALCFDERLLSTEWRGQLLAPVTLPDGRPTSYACGLDIQEQSGRRMICHGGGGGGFASFVAYVPDAGLTVAVLSNNTGARVAPQALGRRAVAMVLGGSEEEVARRAGGRAADPVSRPGVTVDPTLLGALVGRYELAPGFILEIRRENDTLVAQPTGQPPLLMYPESASRWLPRGLDAVIDFQGFEDGPADSLVLVQSGRRMVGKRVG
jgi:CubicO group peptidase (beta-lactamase class C family)